MEISKTLGYTIYKRGSASVCIRVRVCMGKYVCTRLYFVGVCVKDYVWIYECTCVSMSVHLFMCSCVRVSMCVRLRNFVCVCVRPRMRLRSFFCFFAFSAELAESVSLFT